MAQAYFALLWLPEAVIGLSVLVYYISGKENSNREEGSD